MIDIIAHFLFSLFIGWAFWGVFDRKNKRTLTYCLLFSLLSGVFIDLDHLFDYYTNYGFYWNTQLFLSANYFYKTNYVLLHGYEYVLILGFIALFVKNKTTKLYFWIIATSLLVHLLIDIVLSDVMPSSYFIIYRILNGFRSY